MRKTMQLPDLTDCPVCRDPVFPEGSHVMLARAGCEPLYFHEQCMTFGVLFGRKDPLEARLGA
jgi:hypothetical protein